ncbi:MAG TPA: hypothetical protein VGN36_08365, partial [Sphingorhabdus sp.]|nr:hypothetical protein [Sphingorhabdus sp.]
RYRFYTTIARALAGKAELSDSDWSDAWAEIAHTNYIPTAVQGRGRDRPTAEQWKLASHAWPQLLNELRPLNVIVLGLSMWERMPDTVQKFDRFNHDYCLSDGTRVKCCAVRHPSAGLSWAALQEAIEHLEAR